MYGINEFGFLEDKINSVMNYNSKVKDGFQIEVEVMQCVVVRVLVEVVFCMSEGYCFF